jgi:hypothetical protein
MALAKYGPLTQRELTDVTGVFRNMNESRNVAQFTRSDVVRVWETERGLAAMLDPAYPVALPFTNFSAASNSNILSAPSSAGESH